MSTITDAMDEIHAAQSLVQLIEITTHGGDTYSDKNAACAIGAACHAALDRLTAALAVLEKSNGGVA